MAAQPFVPATPARYTEALHFLKARVPITRRRFDRMEGASHRKAFTVSNVAQLDLVNDVWKALDKAISRGDTLADFKRKMGPKLIREWGGTVANPAARMETIFRTNLQISYNEGRVAEALQPRTIARRPFWRYLTVLDGRTSNVCRPLAGVILPANHRFWKTHIPPLHFNCRSTIQPITPAMAKRAGGVKRAPRVKADEGFGDSAAYAQWSPNLADYPKELAQIYKSRKK